MKEVLKKIQKSRIFSLICILLFIGVCFGIGSLIAYIQHEADPTDMAVTYFRAFVQQDYDKMYECLYTDDGYYIDKNIYTTEMKKIRKDYTIDSYEIKEPERKDGRKFVTVKCTDDAAKKVKDFVIWIESARTGIQIVPDYYVELENMMAKGIDITIPKTDKLEINGNVINKKTAQITESKDNNIYHLERILTGKYTISAANDIYARNKTLSIRGEDVKIDMTKEPLTANEEYGKRIISHGKKIINQFYKAVRNRDEKSPALLKMFASKKLKNKVSAAVEKSEEIIFWPEKRNAALYKVLDMKINNLKTAISYNQSDKNYVLTCTYKYKYVSSTDTSLANSYVDKISGTCTSRLTLTYKADGNKLTVKDIRMSNKNKKN